MKDGYETYSVNYGFEGARWSIDIPARSQEEARQRLQLATQFGEVIGPVYSVPAWVPAKGIYVRLACWWKNRFQRV